MLTEDGGRFEFKFPPQEPEQEGDLSPVRDAGPIGARQLRVLQNLRPNVFLARKPGYLQGTRDPSYGRANASQPEITISLPPEPLIIGHGTLPGTEGHLRRRLEVHRQDVNEGQEHWTSA